MARLTRAPLHGLPLGRGAGIFLSRKYLLWSDIPNNRIMRWDETDGTTSVFRQPSNNTNGHTVDRQGRLISCEHLGRRVSRTEFDGTITVLADRFQGKKLNSPNDVVVKSDNSIWFTDPAYGIDWDYEGERGVSEIGRCNVYRIDPQSGDISLVADDFERPNGLAFLPDELEALHRTPARPMWKMDVDAGWWARTHLRAVGSLPARALEGRASDTYPAYALDLPQLQRGGGAPLAAPRIVTVTWSGDGDNAALEAFDDGIGGSAYAAATSRGGRYWRRSRAPRLPRARSTTVTRGRRRAHAGWPMPKDAIHVLYPPAATHVTRAGADACTSTLGAWHDAVTDASANGGAARLAYVVVARCPQTGSAVDSSRRRGRVTPSWRQRSTPIRRRRGLPASTPHTSRGASTCATKSRARTRATSSRTRSSRAAPTYRTSSRGRGPTRRRARKH